MIITSSISDDEAYEMFRRALQDLMLFFPLCGLSILGEAVEVQEDRTIKTLATDGRGIYYSPDWIRGIDHDARVFDILHEWLHIFFNHVARRGDREKDLWNICCDFVVVREACAILTRDGGKVWLPPEDGAIPPDWAKDMTAEEIYDQIQKNQKPPPRPNPKVGGGEHQSSKDFLYDRGAQPGTAVGKEEEFRRKFVDELAQVALIQQQINNNKTIDEMFGPVIGKRLAEILSGSVPWSRLLRGRLLSDMGYDEPSYAPPSMLYYPDIILPQMRSLKQERLMIMVDVSASVGETLMGTFKANVMPAAMRAVETVVVTFDAVVREVVRTKHPRRVLDQIKFLTGSHSHTSVVGAFEVVEKIKPKALVCMTDGHIQLPSKEYPQTIWVIPQNGRSQPWGRNFHMDVSW